MRSRFLKASLVVLTAAVLTISCGGGGFKGSGTFTAVVNEPPKAHAGPDARRLLGSGPVALTGASSSDPNGSPLTFLWSFDLKPGASAATLVGAGTPSPSFTPDVPGLYRFTLTVSDGALSDQDQVEIDVSMNAGPTPHAGLDQDISVGATVTLDGSGSSDPEAQPLTYVWTQVPGYGPDVTGGAGTLSGIAPSFTSPAAPATLLFDLRVDDGFGPSFADRVQVNVFKNPAKAVFVAPWGNDADPGTRSMPLRTLSAALAAAGTIGGDVYLDTVGSFTPTATLVLMPGVSLYGGYDSSEGWQRAPAARSVVQVADPKAVAAANIAVATELSQLAITAASAAAPGGSSYGVFAVNSTGLILRDCSITAGDAGPVGHGSTVGIPASPGQDGSPGQPGCEGGDCGSCTLPEGGAGGRGANGGFGGTGGVPGIGKEAGMPGGQSTDGTPGGEGVESGEGNWEPTSSYWGDDGADGAAGAAGAVGAAAYAVTGYAPVNGQIGQIGQHGKNGGGGGGGGGGILGCDSYGGGGGGGGGGGAGGVGGGGGISGGGSFAVFLWGSNLALDNVILTAGKGGQGGNGAQGLPGGAGGRGGRDGTSDRGNPYNFLEQKDGSNGGRGGDGGNGGPGGRGGGGAGGPSIGIVMANGSVPVLTDVGYSLGSAGSGGSGGAGGPNGISVTTYTP